jgi:hypothetical protein
MIIGDKNTFALESNINEALNEKSLIGIGYFVIYIDNERYGVFEDDATALACSYDEVLNRVQRRGMHISPFSMNSSAINIAKAVYTSLYSEPQSDYFGIPHESFLDIVYSNHLVWAPDGDEAFDDGSYILQFDIDNEVRLIGFKSSENGLIKVKDIILESKRFYSILEKWLEEFNTERTKKLKTNKSKRLKN